MNIKILFVIVTALSMMGITILNSQIALADPDRCVSVQSRDGSDINDDGDTGTGCDQNKQQAKDAKDQCRESDDVKCSSSQTGFGEFGNFYKP